MAMVNAAGPRPPNQALISTAKNGIVAPLLPIASTSSKEAVDQTTAAAAIPERSDQWVVLTITESPRQSRGEGDTGQEGDKGAAGETGRATWSAHHRLIR